MQDKEFNELLAEELEARLLIQQGAYFETPRSSLFGFKRKAKKWHVKPLVYGTIIEANVYAVKIKMNLNEDRLSSILTEMDNNIEPQLNFIATCVLHDKWKIKLFRRCLAKYLMWKLNPETVHKICIGILQMYDLKNFTDSIRLIGTITSPQEPALIDLNTQGLNQPTEL
ncbi:hypothetical protein BAS10_04450 [Elizabethkingia meningoseptica]|uniref:hypothetical protein n=1 Tax=Elizabethkingia meningoseptica TaxID=238 RepID=UPI00099AF208|nr:hypothetical protein [Elizabethkingia meningoseptica]OPB98924.1 hypothetical protein BAS10_04450 [Elizabethkingia meningoseptica]